jgi:dTDP-4-amino-4,6-dideoxygalactose transaminase
MFRDVPSLKNCSEQWPKTRDLLERSIALPVNVMMSDVEINHTAKVLRQAISGAEVIQ